jgi:hypothetical protein
MSVGRPSNPRHMFLPRSGFNEQAKEKKQIELDRSSFKKKKKAI